MTDNSDKPFCFAHLSDPHLSTLEGVRWQQLLNKRILGYLSWLRRRRAEHRIEVLDALQRDMREQHPQQVVVTGDLTHIGLPDEFRQARRWLESLGSPGDVMVIPGNHDAYVAVPTEQGVGQWLAYMRGDEGASSPLPESGPLFPSLRIRGPVAFIGLSTATPSAPFLATGSLGDAQLDRLARVLDKTGERGLCRVVLIHHPPVPGSEKWRKRLTDGQRFCDVLTRHGAELVLHGHGHRAQEHYIRAGSRRIPVIGIPSASAIGHRPGRAAQYSLCCVHRQDPGWRIDIAVRGYDADRDRFSLQKEYARHLAS